MPPTRVRKPSSPDLPDRLRPRKKPVQQRSRALVDAVLEAGTRIFRERGWEGATMARVAEVAGISIGSLYQYFPDKQSLAAAIIERYSEREVAFHMERMSGLGSMSLRESIRAAIRAAIDFSALDPELHRALLDAIPHIGRHELLAQRVRDTAVGFRMLLGAHAREIDHDDLDVATHVLINAIHANTHDGPMPRRAIADERLARELERLIFGYLRL
jgi:AcrR family transcriptional regulator